LDKLAVPWTPDSRNISGTSILYIQTSQPWQSTVSTWDIAFNFSHNWLPTWPILPPFLALYSWLFRLVAQSAATCSCWFLVPRFFYLEDGGDTFLRNVGSHKNYTLPHPRKRHSSFKSEFMKQQLYQYYHRARRHQS
jgi:hypothetical protein